MPSPFPGMDPYLEDSRFWPDVHHGLISEMQARLNSALRPRYHVRVEERIYISDEDDPGRSALLPDLRIGSLSVDTEVLPVSSEKGTLLIAEPIVVPELIDDEIHEAHIEIVGTVSGEVVTVIEIVSPANKIAGARGRQSFQRKRREIMRSSANWVEIDLLRSGKRVFFRDVAVNSPYLVYVSRPHDRPRGRVWPIQLREPLPTIAIPVKSDEPEVAFDLQSLFATVYDRSAFDLVVPYREAASPPLASTDADWAESLLVSKGLRS